MEIDGHFWVERDGKIIDPHFEMYDVMCKTKEADPQKKRYIPASDIIRDKILKKLGYEKVRLKVEWKPQPAHCLLNSFSEAQFRGGKIVFGSMGFERPDGSVYWAFGGENYKIVKHFLK